MDLGSYVAKVRNIGLAAHIEGAKSPVTEHLLYFTGKTHGIGEVNDDQRRWTGCSRSGSGG